MAVAAVKGGSVHWREVKVEMVSLSVFSLLEISAIAELKWFSSCV